MDDPPTEIENIVLLLTEGTPKQQETTINQYFTPTASFTHPFCRTGSFQNSRLLIHSIFRWYKIMSPRISAHVLGIAYDEKNMVLYVDIKQVFAIWFVPFHRSPVRLTTKLSLTRRRERGMPEGRRYYIQSQEDLYPVDQMVKFFAPWGAGTTVVYTWHFIATGFCVLLAIAFAWFTALQERYATGKARGVEQVFMQGVEGIAERRIHGRQRRIDGRQAADQVSEAASEFKQSLLANLDADTDELVQRQRGDNESTPAIEQFGKMQVVT
ncbi:hypothetical protein LTR78_000455 [Recurvomyces mirabilis]|uniref:SigF-like NTF2-like domain-containing protein n=1 Tax=Recurvomyces mirabilis TaxID=574656 RepID=A0AAE0WY08_9PEZI|nr:hypothetical protein LTR78_000455 [Recurvomyces mirabilis]KAK5162110.1 hypothetical protein LTS14_000456 [Recurvomyces mirabilis]